MEGEIIMRKKLITLLLAVCLFASTAGCAFTTTGEAGWEVYFGIKTKQYSEQPGKVQIESSAVDRIIESLTDGKVSNEE